MEDNKGDGRSGEGKEMERILFCVGVLVREIKDEGDNVNVRK